MRTRTKFVALAVAAALMEIAAVSGSVPPAAAGDKAVGDVRHVTLNGTVSPRTGDFTSSGVGDVFTGEFRPHVEAEGEDDDHDAYEGTIVNRCMSKKGKAGHSPSAKGRKRAKSEPEFCVGFEGLNLYQQRYARGGNQFTIEPPDQALCVGNGYVVEAVNDVLNIYNTNGESVLPDNTAANIVAGFPRDVDNAVDLNSFFGYSAAIDRSTGVFGPFVTDPCCLYDEETQRFFVTVLTLESDEQGNFTLVNHLDTAVSKTSDPTGEWNIYRLDVTNDGGNPDGVSPGPYIGDYPHIGADANGFYISTNAYPWLVNAFAGAQIYAFSKKQMAAGEASVTVVHIDTSGMVDAPSDLGPTQPGFTVWPAIAAGKHFEKAHGGTEYFMSSNAADEATHPGGTSGGTYVSDQIIVWSLTNTRSLDSDSPALELTNKILSVCEYALPPAQSQPGAGSLCTTASPLGYAINDTTTELASPPFPPGIFGAWNIFFPFEPPHDEKVTRTDSLDTRMQQVMFANGKLWGALGTAVNPDGGPARAGIAWFIVNPRDGKLVMHGYLGAAGHDFTFPAIAVSESGRGVMAFTATGDDLYPSAAYASIDAVVGVGDWDVVPGGEGAAPHDGFSGYKAFNGDPPRTRWGDYGAACVDGDNVWVASEYIAHAVDFEHWGGPFFVGGTGDNQLGTGAESPDVPGPRAALGNWSTRITCFDVSGKKIDKDKAEKPKKSKKSK